MKTVKRVFLLVMCIWLVGFSAYRLFFEPKPNPLSIIEVIKYDTLTDTLVVEKPVPVFRDTGTYKITRLPADTHAIIEALNKCSELKVYKRTLINDSSLNVVVVDTVQHNEIQASKVYYDFNRKTIISTQIQDVVKNPAHALYIGVSAASIPDVQIMPTVIYTSGRHAVQVSANKNIFLVSYNYLIFSK